MYKPKQSVAHTLINYATEDESKTDLNVTWNDAKKEKEEPVGFHPWGGVDCVSKKAIARHCFPHNAGDNGARMYSNAQTEFSICDVVEDFGKQILHYLQHHIRNLVNFSWL